MKNIILVLLFAVGSMLSAGGPGAHRIEDTRARAMASAWDAAPTRPANIAPEYRWSAGEILALLDAPGAVTLRFNFALNADGDVTVLPASEDAYGTVLSWVGRDTVSKLSITPSQAQTIGDSWRSARMKPRNSVFSISYPADAFRWLLTLPGAATLRSEVGLNDAGSMALVSSALDKDGNLVVAAPTTDYAALPSTMSATASTPANANYIDAGDLCPPICK